MLENWGTISSFIVLIPITCGNISNMLYFSILFCQSPCLILPINGEVGAMGKRGRIFLCAVLQNIVWGVWKERNKCIFKDRKCNVPTFLILSFVR